MPAKEPQPAAQPLVFVVDDDASLREATGRLIRSAGLQVKLLATASEFLIQDIPDAPCCLVLDVKLPGLSGLDFQAELAAANVQLPIVFMTGQGDIPMSVKAMKAGAIEFLTKPFRDHDLLDAIQVGIERDRKRYEREKSLSALRAKFDVLTEREKDVMTCVTAGMLNKQIAAQFGVTEHTVKAHRGNVTRKMGVRSVADLTRMADILGLRSRRP
jgi:FixJ family two-component response regulator